MSFLSAIRCIPGDKIPVINLSDMQFENINHSTETVNKIVNAIACESKDFCEVYCERVTDKCYKVEDVFHRAVLFKFDDISNMRGMDVIYEDMTLHIRLIMESVNRREVLYRPIVEENHILTYNGSTVVVHFKKCRIDAHSQYWEYYVAL